MGWGSFTKAVKNVVKKGLEKDIQSSHASC